MSIVLRIEGVELDLSSEAVIALSKQVAAIGQFQTRLSSFTNKFTIPLTVRNRALLGVESYESGSEFPYTERPASLWYNGVEVASNSRLIIDEVSSDISVTLRPGNSGFFDIIKTLKLRDFDLSDFDHLWNRGNIIIYRNNDWTDGITYPVIDTGNQSQGFQIVLTKGLIAGMFVKYLINRIANEYEYTVSFPTDVLMDELFMPIATQQVGPRITQDVQWKVDKDNQVFVQTVANQTFQAAFDPDFPNKWSNYDNGGTFPIIRLPFRGVYRGNVSFDITIAATASVQVFIVSNILQPFEINIGSVPASGSYDFGFEFSQDAFQDMPIGPLSYAAVWLEFRITDFITTSGITLDNLLWECTEADLKETNYNRPISVQHNLPDITVGQLFIEFGNITGSYYDINDIDGIIRVVKLTELFDGKQNPYPWQQLIDESKEKIVKYSIAGFGQVNVFKWADDSERNFEIQCFNDLLPDTVNIVESRFITGNDRVWQGSSLNTAFFNIYDIEAQRIQLDNTPRIMRVLSGSIIANFFESTLESGNVNGFNIGFFQGLEWANLYENRYASIIGGIIDRMLYAEIFFTIDEFDLIDFDFSRPVYLQSPNGYFYVQRISEFTGKQESTKFVMIRI
jgi:hypothetical protein